MYTKDTIVRRPSLRWVERRRYFRRLLEQARLRVLKGEAALKIAPVSEKD